MEASGTPTPPADPAPAQPQATNEKAGGGMRTLAVLLALVIAIAAVFTAALAVVGADSVQCDDTDAILEKLAENPGEDVTCYESGIARVAAIGLGGISTVILAIAALIALAFAITGRRNQQSLMLRLLTVGVAVGGLGYLIAAID